MDLLQKNKEMLLANKYNTKDTMQLSRIASLINPNDYDLYLIACALCNYDIPEKAEARDLRMQLFIKTNGSKENYEHKESDYGKLETKLKCTNTGKTNKYGLYEYEININDRDLVSDLWEYKTKDCLKYVDSKTYADKLIVSISKTQLSNFKNMLDTLGISYDAKNMEEGIIFTNKCDNKLIDINTLNLPFTPYDFQIEDAEKILKTKRALLGHEMGCISGDAIVKIKVDDSNITSITLADLYNKQPKNAKIESYEDNKFKFIPINAILDKGKKQVLKIITTNTNIKCTYDHEILTTTGWVPASKLNIGNIIISNTNKIEQIINIEYLDEEINVYDVAVDSFITSNFVANGLVVHNCGKTFISILVGTSIGENTKITYDTLDNLNYDDIVITDKGPLPIGKIVEENIDCKVQVTKNGKTKFVNILDRGCTTE